MAMTIVVCTSAWVLGLELVLVQLMWWMHITWDILGATNRLSWQPNHLGELFVKISMPGTQELEFYKAPSWSWSGSHSSVDFSFQGDVGAPGGQCRVDLALLPYWISAVGSSWGWSQTQTKEISVLPLQVGWCFCVCFSVNSCWELMSLKVCGCWSSFFSGVLCIRCST